MKDTRSDDGQVLPLVVLVLMAAMLGAIGLGRLGTEVATRARATTAADAAALAGATDGRSAAEALARENGGRLVHFEQLGPTDVRVVVTVDGVVAHARARVTEGDGTRRFAPEGQG